DLDQIGLQTHPKLQIGIARAVIVQRQADAVLAQAQAGLLQAVHVVARGVLLGELDDEIAWRHAAIAEQMAGQFGAPTVPAAQDSVDRQIEQKLAAHAALHESAQACASAS